MSGPPIPTSQLTPKIVPRPTERDRMIEFALTWGGVTEDVRKAYARRKSLLTGEVADLDTWSIDDIRLDLFQAQRTARREAEQGDDTAWPWFFERAEVFVATIRHRLFGDPKHRGA